MMNKELYTNEANVDLEINGEFAIKSLEECEIACIPEVAFIQAGNPFLQLKVACYFSVQPTQWKEYIQKESQSIVFPKGFTDHLLMLATGTLRGILHAKTENTIFNQFILPTINVTALTQGDTVINI
ncbi:hypothetical protein D0T50_06925 [Bacteroides sp. 214]|nr:hypothetical protein [Bacteroides sp. 214]